LKNFDSWNEVKKRISNNSPVYTKEGEVYYAILGVNVGYEQDGKGELYLRPIVVYKKFGRDSILAIPLTSQKKSGRFYYSFQFKKDVVSVALLSQIRLLDTRRVYKKVGRMKFNDFKDMKKKFQELTI